MDALKLRTSVCKPSLLREVFDSVVEEVCGRKFSTGRVSDVGAGGVSGAAWLAAAISSVDAEAHLHHLYEPRCIRTIQKVAAHRHPMHRTRVRFYLVDYTVEQMFDADPRL